MNESLAAESASKSTGALATEFLILTGDLLLASSSANVGDAESLYRRAVHNAQEVRAPMVELRAATRLSRLWLNQGKKEPAQILLSEAYSKISEGFTTADLKEASAILAKLS
jgi:predicted ATPase